MTVGIFIYRAAFQRQEIGYAAAAGVVLFVIVFVIGQVANRLLGVGRSSDMTTTTAPVVASQTGGRTSRRRRPITLGRTILYVVLTIIAAIVIMPLVWTLTTSFKERGDMFAYPPKLLPNPATLENYQNLFAQAPFGSWFITTVIVAVVSTALAAFVCSLAGFGFAMYRFPGKNFLFSFMFGALAIPYIVGCCPCSSS